MFSPGQKVMHPLYGLGNVEKKEVKKINGVKCSFYIISFQNDRLKIMVNSEQKNEMIRNLISRKEIPKVLKFLKSPSNGVNINSADRYNINMKKIKTANIYQLAEVIKDLIELSKVKKLTPKEQAMLKDSKKMMSAEFSYVANKPQEFMESLIEESLNTRKA